MEISLRIEESLVVTTTIRNTNKRLTPKNGSREGLKFIEGLKFTEAIRKIVISANILKRLSS